MKKSILGLVAIGSLIAAPAMAADLRMPVKAPPAPIVPVFSWSGCYIGADVGGAWAHEDANNNNPTILAAVNQAPDFVRLDGSSVIGGGFLGCNMQFNSIVVGIEGDWSGTHISDTKVGPNLFANGLPVGSGSVTFSRTVDWLASIRGRIGYTLRQTRWCTSPVAVLGPKPISSAKTSSLAAAPIVCQPPFHPR